MEFALEKELMMIGRLLIAGLCGGVIGHERENRRKPAGSRCGVGIDDADFQVWLQ